MINANYKGPVKFTAPSGGVVGGQGYLHGAIFLAVIVSAAKGERVDGERVGCFTFPKKAADNFAEGAKVYWDNTEKEITSTAADNYLVGFCETISAVDETDIRVYLTGELLTVEPGA